MIIDGLEISGMVVDGVHYTTVHNLLSGEQTRQKASMVKAALKAEVPSDWDLLKKINCVTMFYAQGDEATSKEYGINVPSIKLLVKLFEKDDL